LPAKKLQPRAFRLLVRIARQYRHLMANATMRQGGNDMERRVVCFLSSNVTISLQKLSGEARTPLKLGDEVIQL
jgi:hypothetical protein